MPSSCILPLLLIAASARCTPPFTRDLPWGDADAASLGKASLREMFREVEELMEDTQLKLQGAAREMALKQGRMSRDLDRLSDNYRNRSKGQFGAGNPSAQRGQEIQKECIVDEDCTKHHFCQVDMSESKCLRRRAREENCTRDGECYSAHRCVWGQCKANAVTGETGSICEQQGDCSADLCCAFHTYLLYPVCTPLPNKGQPCHDPAHRLLDLITWEMEPEGALDRCPCSKGLTCQPHGNALMSVCKDTDAEQGEVTTDPPEYVEMGNLPFVSLVAGEDPGDGETFDWAEPGMEEVRAIESAALDALRSLYDKGNLEPYDIEWDVPQEGKGRDGREPDLMNIFEQPSPTVPIL
uniref:dickkopf-related protein 3-like n=1 Tax=Pristiophorus japonicus TaxID=55135 RepID=UPI00398E537F